MNAPGKNSEKTYQKREIREINVSRETFIREMRREERIY